MIRFVCKVPLLARAFGLKAARPSARETIGYIVYNDNVIFQLSEVGVWLCIVCKILLFAHALGLNCRR